MLKILSLINDLLTTLDDLSLNRLGFNGLPKSLIKMKRIRYKGSGISILCR